MHRTPTQLGPRENNPPRDRYDDPELRYRVRYFATTTRGAMLEVLDHFRPDPNAESEFDAVPVDDDLIDISREEPPGLVREQWLSQQRLVLATVPSEARFVDVANPDVLAELNKHPKLQSVLSSADSRALLGDAARIDGATIRLAGPVGRRITQAVSRLVHDDDANYTGIGYRTRFDDSEACWAVFDDRVHVQFQDLQALDNTNPEHTKPLNDVARRYDLRLPVNWQDNQW